VFNNVSFYVGCSRQILKRKGDMGRKFESIHWQRNVGGSIWAALLLADLVYFIQI
jgi:hypothetical protein